MKLQVNKSHYEFSRYISKGRWCSLWHQLAEVLSLMPDRVLEIGPGPGIFKGAAAIAGVKVETLDFDPELKPDYVGSVTQIPLPESTFDVVCAFQVLEHMPYDQSILAFQEMVRVSKKNIVISLPDALPRWRYLIHVPAKGPLEFFFKKPFHKMKAHVFDGEHYWEINKRNYELSRVVSDLSQHAELLKTYIVSENTYHRFFIFQKRALN